jgi:Flp pilus assembly protein TadD
VTCYREAVLLKPQDAELHANLGTALARLSRLAEAVPEFEIALSIDPNLETVKRSLNLARTMLKTER